MRKNKTTCQQDRYPPLQETQGRGTLNIDDPDTHHPKPDHAPFTLFVVLCLLTRSAATTVVIAITPTGIVIGTDEKTQPAGTAVKVVLLKQRFIVANIDIETAKATDTGIVLYCFPQWTTEIDKKTSPKVSVTELSSIIKNNIPNTFNFIIGAIKSGKLTRENAQSVGLDPDGYIVEYIVAGYEHGSAVIHWITVLPDWDNHTVKEVSDTVLYPGEGDSANPYIRPLGRHIGIDALQTTDSDEQRKLEKRIPIEFGIMRQKGTLTLNQASNVVRSILAIEIEAEPTYVGFPIAVVTVPRVRPGWSRTYRTDVSPLSTLPKNLSRREQQGGSPHPVH